MKIFLNNDEYFCEEGASLSDFLNSLSLKQNNIAIAVNEKVIPFSLIKTIILKENDNIIIIKAAQGG